MAQKVNVFYVGIFFMIGNCKEVALPAGSSFLLTDSSGEWSKYEG